MLIHNAVITGSLTFPTALPISGSLLVSGSVGIGTVSPSEALHLYGTSTSPRPALFVETTNASATPEVRLFQTSGRSILMNLQTNGDWSFQNSTNNSSYNTRLTISSAGTSSFGSTAISTAADAATITIKQHSTTHTNGIYLERSGERNGYYMYVGGSVDSLNFRRNYFGTQSDVMSLTRDGNVGIGTGSPGNLLSLVQSNSAASTTLDISNSSNANNTTKTSQLLFRIADTVGDLKPAASITATPDNANNLASALYFSTRASDGGPFERMRITSGGTVGIGGTAGSGILQAWGVNQSSANYALGIYNSGGFGLFFVRNDGAHFLSSFTYNNTVTGGVRNLYIDSTYALGGISSIRASKKNIQEFDSNWIYDLKPVQFNYRKKDEEGNFTEEIFDELNYGLIAEDTAPVADFLINYNDKEDGTKEMVGIEYMRLITPMLKAIQELKAENETLTARITALENK